MMLPHMEAFFGGAAGGGKSEVLLMLALQYADVPGYSTLILRRTFTELKQAGALLNRARTWLSDTDAKYLAEEHTYEFPTFWPNGKPGPPSRLQFGFLGDYNVEIRYQGAEYQRVLVDEVTQFENDIAYTYLFSRIRKNVCPKHQLKESWNEEDQEPEMVPNYVDGCPMCDLYRSMPVGMRAAGNPGGPGMSWVKNRFQISREVYNKINKKTGQEEKRVKWVGSNPNAPFIPSKLTDNKFIDQSSYKRSLKNLDEVRRMQLEEGDWDVSPDSRFHVHDARFYKARGEYFDLDGTVYHLSDLKKIFATVDPAASLKSGPIDTIIRKGGPSFTVISTWGLTHDYKLIWLHMRRFRKEIPEIIDDIVEIYRMFKHQYFKMETNGVGLGASQLVRAKGVPVVPNPKATDKLENATNALYRVKNHRVYWPEQASWLKENMDEIFTWTGQPGMPDDIVDTLSDACNDVTWDAQGQDVIFQNDDPDFGMPKNSPIILPVNVRY